MTREIKFRAWDKKGSGMFCNIQNGIEFSDLSHYTFLDFLGNPNAIGDCHDWIVMQYTGFKDKNGVEIFEGDIVRVDGSCGIENSVVGYENQYGGYMIFLCDHEDEYLADFIEEVEVIGNIYENHELLNKTT